MRNVNNQHKKFIIPIIGLTFEEYIFSSYFNYKIAARSQLSQRSNNKPIVKIHSVITVYFIEAGDSDELRNRARR